MPKELLVRKHSYPFYPNLIMKIREISSISCLTTSMLQDYGVRKTTKGQCSAAAAAQIAENVLCHGHWELRCYDTWKADSSHHLEGLWES